VAQDLDGVDQAGEEEVDLWGETAAIHCDEKYINSLLRGKEQRTSEAKVTVILLH
jgi:hypothetical protein